MLAQSDMLLTMDEWILALWIAVTGGGMFFFFAALYREIYVDDLDNEDRVTELTSPFLKMLMPFCMA